MRYNALSAKSKAAAQETAGIDQNHTHFLMVDDGNDKFGGELSLRTALEEHIKEELKARRPSLSSFEIWLVGAAASERVSHPDFRSGAHISIRAHQLFTRSSHLQLTWSSHPHLAQSSQPLLNLSSHP